MLKENSSASKANDKEYRNKLDFLTDDNQIIDAGSLWKFNGNQLVLVDDDNHVETQLDLTIFEIAE